VTTPLTAFVYFKVASTVPEGEVRAALHRLAMLRSRDGWRFDVMRRHRERSGSGTWMEVHRDVPRDELDAWLDALARAAREAGLDALAPGGRHVEVFEAPG
jgi:hypothetical protein